MKIVISAVNFTEGGPIEILRQAVDSIIKILPESEVIVLVNNINLKLNPCAKLIAYPQCKRSYLIRLLYEYFFFDRLSRLLKPNIWLSLHDISPRVVCGCQAVYMHNPLPFHSFSASDIWFSPFSFVLSKLYWLAYILNVNSNNHVIVQQQWMRQRLSRHIRYPSRIVVAHPGWDCQDKLLHKQNTERCKPDKCILFYPALPRFFKNFELIIAAASLLDSSINDRLEIRLTISGNENRYAKAIVNSAKHIHVIKFMGILSPSEVNRQYLLCDAVLFPSRLETWGLPLTEASVRNKTIVVSDLPYAYESLSLYHNATFLPPNDPSQWATIITSIVQGSLEGSTKFIRPEIGPFTPLEPFCQNWDHLWKKLLENS